MKFTLKTLVAAVALAAAGHAMAEIQPGNVNGVSGELVFFAYGLDASGNAAAYVKDLGVTFGSFAATPSYSLTNIGADTNWIAFNSASLVGPKNWGVFGLEKVSSSTTVANAFSIMTTATGDDVSVISSLKNTNLANAFGKTGTGITGVNVGNINYAVNDSYYFDTSTSGLPQNLGSQLGSDFGSNGVFLSSTNVIGTTTTAHMFDISRGVGTTPAGVPTVADINVNGQWTFNGNTLDYTVAAIPEPETYGMLLAGLMMIGVIARRRMV